MSYRGDVNKIFSSPHFDTISQRGFVLEIAARADAEIAELRRDAERYRIGHDRYETVRRMSLRAFGDACSLNLLTGKPFDQIVDELRPFMFPSEASKEVGDGG